MVRYWNGRRWTHHVQPMPRNSALTTAEPPEHALPEGHKPRETTGSRHLEGRRYNHQPDWPLILVVGGIALAVALVAGVVSYTGSPRGSVRAQASESPTTSPSGEANAEVRDTEAGLMKIMYLCLEASAGALEKNVADIQNLPSDDQADMLQEVLADCGDRYINRLGADWMCNSTGCTNGTHGMTWSEASKTWIRIRDDMPADMRAH